MSKHSGFTPGPWHMGTLPSPEWRYICDDTGSTIAAVAEWNENGVLIQNFAEDAAKANARLIAAAPDLHAELHRQLEAHYATWMAARAEVEGAATASMLFEKEPEVISARAAMTKALGKEPARTAERERG